jgi:hypothetical protein
VTQSAAADPSSTSGIYSSLEWNPTPEQMEAFRNREVVLAKVNIKRLRARGFQKIAFDDLICSTRTFSAALEQLRENV